MLPTRLSMPQCMGSFGALAYKEDLVVHPPSSHHCWLEGDAWLPSWLVTTALAPHEGVFMRLPVGGRGGNGLTDVGPILKPASFERQRPQEFPPRFDQVEIGGVGRLEDKLPARMGQVEQEYIHRAVGTQIVQHRVDPFVLAGQPAVYSFQEVYPGGNRAAGVGDRERIARRRTE